MRLEGRVSSPIRGYFVNFAFSRGGAFFT